MLYRNIYMLSGEMESNNLSIKNPSLKYPCKSALMVLEGVKINVNIGVYFLLFHLNQCHFW